jgi:hypothetical protein
MAYTLAPIMTSQIRLDTQYNRLFSAIKLSGMNASSKGEKGIEITTNQRVHLGTNLPFGNIQNRAMVGAVNKNAMKKLTGREICSPEYSRTSIGPGIITAYPKR